MWRGVKLAKKAEETQRLPAASRDDPTLKGAQTSRGGHPSCDGTADYLRDCGSVGHLHQATTGTTSPKREVWAACRNWNRGTYFLRRFSEREDRTSRDPGAAPPCQKTARPASEVVRHPAQRSSRQKVRRPQGPVREGRAQGPWRCGATGCCSLLRQLLPRYGRTVGRVSLQVSYSVVF